MPFGIKCIFTVAAILVGITFYFIDSKANNAGPDWIWRGGKNDFFRNMICKEDGSFRKYTKAGAYLWFALFILIIWLTP
ncbi:hypothetical protein Pan241w_37740 [Gimesia alba]|uniref:Uncharacterized protein n=1 Tax=Gimesia alba TaxID=2527973 RepID=A0A517RIH4_9PLAN|nr:hypothetical protein [Gimesia alba]QDT43672.1 hypothetical protein Pan241w_37740 [Gimesia alba]